MLEYNLPRMTMVIDEYELWPGIKNRAKLMIAIVAVASLNLVRDLIRWKITRDVTSQHSRLNDQTY